MQNFTPVSALVGGVLIALGLAGILLGQGRVAGISGIVAGAIRNEPGDRAWRLFFLAGVVATGLLSHLVYPAAFDHGPTRGIPLLVGAGLLVGFGTRLGNGCTSGHGVCGNSRLSRRSIVATLTFMAFGAATAMGVSLIGAPLGGQP